MHLRVVLYDRCPVLIFVLMNVAYCTGLLLAEEYERNIEATGRIILLNLVKAGGLYVLFWIFWDGRCGLLVLLSLKETGQRMKENYRNTCDSNKHHTAEFNSAREAAEEDIKRNSDDVIQFFDQ
nr:kinesin-like protein KIN-5C [Ipomoea batatas]